MSPLRSPENDRSGRSSASTSPPAGNAGSFTFKTEICGIEFEVRREGKHLNLDAYSESGWTFEPIADSLIFRLESLIEAMKLAQEKS